MFCQTSVWWNAVKTFLLLTWNVFFFFSNKTVITSRKNWQQLVKTICLPLPEKQLPHASCSIDIALSEYFNYKSHCLSSLLGPTVCMYAMLKYELHLHVSKMNTRLDWFVLVRFSLKKEEDNTCKHTADHRWLEIAKTIVSKSSVMPPTLCNSPCIYIQSSCAASSISRSHNSIFVCSKVKPRHAECMNVFSVL